MRTVSMGGGECASLWESEPDEYGWFGVLGQNEDGEVFLGITDMESHDIVFNFVPANDTDLAALADAIAYVRKTRTDRAIELPPASDVNGIVGDYTLEGPQ